MNTELSEDLKKLLRKRKLRGKEAGILSLTDRSHVFKQTQSGIKEPVELFDREALHSKILKMDQYDFDEYRRYEGIYAWMRFYFNLALMNTQQAQFRIELLLAHVREAIIAEGVEEYIQQQPIAMSKEQYDREKQEAIQEVLHKNTDDDKEDSGHDLFYTAVNYYSERLEKGVDAKNLLSKYKGKYQSELFTNKSVLSKYNTVMNRFYYQLTDGRRSDQMSREEWDEAVKQDAEKNDFTDLLVAHVKKHWEEGRLDDLYTSNHPRFKRVFFTDPPEGLTKWQMIASLSWRNFFKEAVDADKRKNDELATETFIAEFPDIAKAIIKDIDSKGVLPKKLSKTSLKEWHDITVPLIALYNKNVYGAKDLIDADYILTKKHPNLIKNGVAIVNSKTGRRNKQGDFIKPINPSVAFMRSLRRFYEDPIGHQSAMQDIKASRHILLNSYFFLLAYNALIEMVAKQFNIPDFVIFKANVERVKSQIEALNKNIYLLVNSVTVRRPKGSTMQDEKLKVIQEYFNPIRYQDIVITEARKRWILPMFSSFLVFKDNDITLRFCDRQIDLEG